MKSLASNLSRKKPCQQRETISHFSGQDNNELHLSSLQSLAYPKGRPNDIAIHPIPGGYFESNTPTPATMNELYHLSWHMWLLKVAAYQGEESRTFSRSFYQEIDILE